MKKSIFILAALFATAIANAQITLERTINDFVYPKTYSINGFSAKYVYGDLLWTGTPDQTNTIHVTVYDAYSYDEITTFKFSGEFFFIAARGYFTNTNEVSVLLCQNNQLTLISESGEVLQNLGETSIDNGIIPQIITFTDGTCKLFVWSGDYDQGYTTKIYSLPGNGNATAVSTPSSPERSARKIAREGQVFVQTDNNTYTIQGQEVK